MTLVRGPPGHLIAFPRGSGRDLNLCRFVEPIDRRSNDHRVDITNRLFAMNLLRLEAIRIRIEGQKCCFAREKVESDLVPSPLITEGCSLNREPTGDPQAVLQSNSCYDRLLGLHIGGRPSFGFHFFKLEHMQRYHRRKPEKATPRALPFRNCEHVHARTANTPWSRVRSSASAVWRLGSDGIRRGGSTR